MVSNLTRKADIIIVDDHLIFRQGLKSIITIKNIATIIGEATNGAEFIELLSRLKPDLVLMNIDMPRMDALETIQKAMTMMPEIKIIAFTMFEDEEYYYKMIEFGVKGFILKSSGVNELENAIHEVLKGERYISNDLLRKIVNNFDRKNTGKPIENTNLTPREMEVLQQICLGLNNGEIAQKLVISAKTVKSHRANLLEKTGLQKYSGNDSFRH